MSGKLSQNHTLRSIQTHFINITTLILLGLLASCSGDDYIEGSGSSDIESINITSVSADGTTATISATIAYNIGTSPAFLKIGLENEDFHRDSLLLDSPQGTANLSFALNIDPNTPNPIVESWFTINENDAKNSRFAENAKGFNTLFSLTPSRQLTEITDINLIPVEGSYEFIENPEPLEPDEHRFRFRVQDQNAQSVTGLETNFKDYFSIIENNALPDRESIQTGTEESEQLSTYFVIDASDSIVQANSEAAVRDSVSKTVVSLSGLSDFNYRQFATQIKTLPNGINELDYDPDDRFTSLYHAIDVTLDDIANNPNKRQKVMIVFTDGQDNFSRNYYKNDTLPYFIDPNFTKDDTYQYLLDRIQTIANNTQGGLTLYTIGLGDKIDQERLTELAGLTQGAFVLAESANDLEASFSEIFGLIRSTYTLSYLSPNKGKPNFLSLRIDLNGLSDEYDILP